ncbi:MAG TPA: septal ring lytic transglycosylase RlpA family protein [Magnetospirillaceae bacterium]|jgi:rare lipoprotein A
MLGAKLGLRLLLLIAGCALLANCSETKFASMAVKEISSPNAPPGQGHGVYKVGEPYQIAGVWYYPAEDYNYDETGIASWYGPNFHGKFTANGEVYDQNDVTAAHRTLPMPSIVRVTNLENGRSLIVRINDRGPYAHNRIIDLSRRSAQLLGVLDNGTARVRVQIMADDSRALAMQLKGGQQPELVASAAAPRDQVQAETLPAPGSTEKPKPVTPVKPAVAPAAAAPPPPATTSALDGAQLAKQQVQTVPVKATQIFIQAGAFQKFDNAHRLSALLSPFGPTNVTQVTIKGGLMFRVRLGPIKTVDEADALLERVIGAGHPDARIIVD